MAGKHPTLPSNYVSLAVLKERWLEQQRKQSQEEELQRKHEEDQKKKIQIQNGGKSLQKSQSSSTSVHASLRNYRITRVRDGHTSLASKPILKESDSETSVSVSKVEQVEDKVIEKAKKKPETCRKPRAAEKLSVPTSRFQPVEKIQVHSAARNEKIEEAGCEFPHNSIDQAAKHNFWKPRVRMSTSGKTNHQYSRGLSKGEFSSQSPPVEQLQATEKNYKIEEAGYKFPHNSVDQATNHNVSNSRVRMGIAGNTNHQYSREFSKEDFSSPSPPIEQLQADTTEKNYRIEEAGCEFPHNSVDQAANHDVCKPRVKLSIAGKTNHHHQYSNHFQKWGFRQKQKDSKQVWVKKGETTATHSSDTGISVNGGGASSSYSSQDTNGTTSIW